MPLQLGNRIGSVSFAKQDWFGASIFCLGQLLATWARFPEKPSQQRKSPCPMSTCILIVCLAASRNSLRGGALATKNQEKVRWITAESASIRWFHRDSTELIRPKLAPLPIRRALRGARQRHPWRKVRRRKMLGFKKEPRPTKKRLSNGWATVEVEVTIHWKSFECRNSNSRLRRGRRGSSKIQHQR